MNSETNFWTSQRSSEYYIEKLAEIDDKRQNYVVHIYMYVDISFLCQKLYSVQDRKWCTRRIDIKHQFSFYLNVCRLLHFNKIRKLRESKGNIFMNVLQTETNANKHNRMSILSDLKKSCWTSCNAECDYSGTFLFFAQFESVFFDIQPYLTLLVTLNK